MKTCCTKLVILVLASFICLLALGQKSDEKMPRKEELILEGIINDFILRNQVKREFPFPYESYQYEAYSSVLAKSIVVYVYGRIAANIGYNECEKRRSIAEKEFPKLEQYMKEGIKKTILDFEDFKWAKDYELSIVPRISIESAEK